MEPIVEEELPEPGGRRLRAAIVVTALLAVVAAFAVRLVTRHEPGHAQAGAAPTTPTTTRTVPPWFPAPSPQVVYVFPSATPGRVLVPPLPTPCPADATQCEVYLNAPPKIVAAVRAAFPGADVRSVVSEFVNLAQHFEPDLLARRVVATRGATRIMITLARPDTVYAPSASPTHGIEVVTSVTGFTVTVDVRNFSTPSGAVISRAQRLAADDRLLVAY